MLRRSDEAPERPKSGLAGEIANLKESLAAYLTEHKFEPGTIIRQKPACRVYNEPSENKIAIVVKMLSDPRQGSCPGEVDDMLIAYWLAEGKRLVLIQVCSARWEPV